MRLLQIIAALLLLASSGCAVGATDQARAIDDDQVPFGLLDEDRTPGTVAGPNSEGSIFVLDGDGAFVAVARFDQTDGAAAAVTALQQPTTAAERSRGLQSPLGDAEGQLLLEASVRDGVARVELGAAFGDLDASTQRAAVAQAALTFTDLAGIGQVSFTIGGEPVSVPVGDGATSAAPVTRDDYAELLARA